MKPPRLRILAGPNGSGKSTLAKQLMSKYAVNLYTFLNSDELYKEISAKHKTACPFACEQMTLIRFIEESTYPEEYKAPFLNSEIQIKDDDYIYCSPNSINSYTSAMIADFFKQEYLRHRVSFSFETVFSHPAKIEILKQAQNSGYRTYMYFVATETPEINIERIQLRVKQHGHNVPADKTRDRFHRCLAQIKPALPYLNRAYFFDNTLESTRFLAEYNPETGLTFYTSDLPLWFTKSVMQS